MNRFLLCLRGALYILATLPALAKEPAAPPEYPPGLFENSPVVGAPPAAPPPNQPDADPATQDDCADIASRVFRSLAEVKAAHARCDGRSGPDEPN